jgi:hypothetical protein
MSNEKPHPDQAPPPDEPASTDRPPTDTSTDWDEWMEKHGGRPRPRPDVADREGKLTDEK